MWFCDVIERHGKTCLSGEDSERGKEPQFARDTSERPGRKAAGEESPMDSSGPAAIYRLCFLEERKQAGGKLQPAVITKKRRRSLPP